jgi:predicted HNH restriction endonuclease
MKINKHLERNLFDFYKKKIPDKQAFENFADNKLSYQVIAYLFFIKDCKRYLPISQRKFDKIFERIGLADFKTSYKISWDNYVTFLDIIRQVQKFLLLKDKTTTLVDAHSFLWVLGNQMQNPKFILRLNSRASIKDKNTEAIQTVKMFGQIAEEDDSESFPEGKEAYRLHRSKERNQGLVRKAKEKHFNRDPKMCCQVCKFSFIDRYGKLGKGYIEAHHLFPISELKQETETKIDDLIMVCSNCHRMLHRRRPWVKFNELKSIIRPPK